MVRFLWSLWAGLWTPKGIRARMVVVLEWHGDAASVVALERVVSSSPEVALRLPRDPPHVPSFALEEQAACLGLAVTQAPPTAAPTPHERVHDELLRRGYRAVVVACRSPLDASFVGRVLDGPLLRHARQLGGEDALETFVFDGPAFRRRVDVVALDAEPADDGWRVPLGLRGC